MNITLNLGANSYEIVLERGAILSASKYLNLNRKVFIVTDDGVPELYANNIKNQCKKAIIYTLPQGEASKNVQSFTKILENMLSFSLGRGDCVIAVGGGVVGDLAGFCASCYMRGIDFYNIPTTLLSQLDSSIGGKTAIDFCGVKNIVGSFYQPKKVLIDPDTLSTLDNRQFNAGLAEAIKMSATFDKELFEFIESSEDARKDIEQIIYRSLLIKRDVVEKDEKETSLRKVLNFGHTIGHAIESLNNGKLLHGECVALGMPPMCSKEIKERIINVLEKNQLNTKITDNSEELLPYLIHDKKSQGDKISAIFVENLGSFVIKELTAEEILRNL